MAYVKVQPIRGLCNQLGAICWAIERVTSYKHTGVWIDGMVVDADNPKVPRVPAETFLNLEASSKALGIPLVDHLPPGGRVVLDLGQTKYDHGNMARFVHLLVFAGSLHKQANEFIRDHTGSPYSAVHLRIEGDMLKHIRNVLKWSGDIRGQVTKAYSASLTRIPNDLPLFVASNFGKSRKTVGMPLPATEGFKTIQTPAPAAGAKDRDLRAAVDFLICVQAGHFVGAPFSSFSHAVALVRKASEKPTLWIETPV
jgi:hypothetical protein